LADLIPSHDANIYHIDTQARAVPQHQWQQNHQSIGFIPLPHAYASHHRPHSILGQHSSVGLNEQEPGNRELSSHAQHSAWPQEQPAWQHQQQHTMRICNPHVRAYSAGQSSINSNGIMNGGAPSVLYQCHPYTVGTYGLPISVFQPLQCVQAAPTVSFNQHAMQMYPFQQPIRPNLQQPLAQEVFRPQAPQVDRGAPQQQQAPQVDRGAPQQQEAPQQCLQQQQRPQERQQQPQARSAQVPPAQCSNNQRQGAIPPSASGGPSGLSLTVGGAQPKVSSHLMSYSAVASLESNTHFGVRIGAHDLVKEAFRCEEGEASERGAVHCPMQYLVSPIRFLQTMTYLRTSP